VPELVAALAVKATPPVEDAEHSWQREELCRRNQQPEFVKDAGNPRVASPSPGEGIGICAAGVRQTPDWKGKSRFARAIEDAVTRAKLEMPMADSIGNADSNLIDGVVCHCERCQMKLPEYLGTYTPGIRGSMAWRCAVCLPIEGPSGRLLRDKVVSLRKAHLKGSPE
jgi:hypothetical protein